MIITGFHTQWLCSVQSRNLCNLEIALCILKYPETSCQSWDCTAQYAISRSHNFSERSSFQFPSCMLWQAWARFALQCFQLHVL